jgi:hypothetical protein
MILAYMLNLSLVLEGGSALYLGLMGCQFLFYGLAILGWLLEKQAIRIKILFIPYYFCMMNYAVIAGIQRYLGGKQSAAWEKSKRK